MSRCRRSFPWERQLIEWVWAHHGQPAIQIQLWDGSMIGPSERDSVGKLILHNPYRLYHLLAAPSMAMGEGYCRGDIAIEGELTEVLTELLSALMQAHPHPPRPPGIVYRWMQRWRHTLSSSQLNVHHHYDIGNDFYQLWLDRQMVYTCAYYENPLMTLEQAQLAKFDHVCRKLRLQPGERVVEAGCGWGTFALHMARSYKVQVDAYNISHEQIGYARQKAREEGLEHLVRFIEEDYRNIRGQYDVFVSIGMLEHVGVDQYPKLARLMDRVLSSHGRGLIHTIGRNFPRPLDPWIAKRIFPGAEPPSLRQMFELFEPIGLSILDVENLRLHYARTCQEWLQRFEKHRDEVARMFDEDFVRMWRFYLASSIAAFRTGHLQLFQVLFSRPMVNTLPLTRADIYQHLWNLATPAIVEPTPLREQLAPS